MDPTKFTSFVLDIIKKRTKIKYVSIDNKIFSLHYRITSLLFLVFSTVIAVTSFFGKDTHFTCIKSLSGSSDGIKLEQKVIDNYCWIEGSFVFPRAIMESIKDDERGIINPNVRVPTIPHRGIVNSKGALILNSKKELPPDEVLTTTYYQWVPIVLFFQSLTFWLPHLLWKNVFENGLQKKMVDQLFKPVCEKVNLEKQQRSLIEYLYQHRGGHNNYALKYFFCEVLNLVHILVQFAFMNWFLDGRFWSYGWTVLTSNEPRPMEKVFPTLTKCTFYRYGPSGDIQHFDNLCILPLNIINEKGYLMVWWWLVALFILTFAAIFINAFAILFYKARYYSLSTFNRMVDEVPYRKVLDSISYGDWFFLYLLSKNLDPFHYRTVILQLAARIEKGKSGREMTGSSLLDSEERPDSSSRGTSSEKDHETPI